MYLSMCMNTYTYVCVYGEMYVLYTYTNIPKHTHNIHIIISPCINNMGHDKAV